MAPLNDINFIPYARSRTKLPRYRLPDRFFDLFPKGQETDQKIGLLKTLIINHSIALNF